MQIQNLKVFTLLFVGLFCLGDHQNSSAAEKQSERKLLYVAVPGIRDYLEYGGHGILVFDINNGHQFVKRFPSAGLDENGRPLHVKGIAYCAKTRRLYITTTRTLLSFALVSEKLL